MIKSLEVDLDNDIKDIATKLLFLKGSVLNTLRYICEKDIKTDSFYDELNFYLDINQQIYLLNNVILLNNNLSWQKGTSITIDSDRQKALIEYEMD